jgi:adenylate cyclase
MDFIRPDPYGSSTLCVLFADVSGSTQLFEILGDIEGSGVIRTCLKHMNAATESFGGRSIQPVGDGLLTAFPTPELAAEAAEEMMRRIHREPRVGGKHLALRIGLHYGPVIVRTSNIFGGQINIFGDTVNVAARITALAKARQILTSDETLALLPFRWRQSARSLSAFSLKGKSEDIGIYEILWQNPDTITAIHPIPQLFEGATSRLTLRYHQQRFILDSRTRGLTFGREITNDVVIDDRYISRQHARIERRRDKFVLIDSSTNGTYVGFEGESELPIRMEEIILHSEGRISLGQPYDSGDTLTTFEFEVR